jgi:hypothetical protein
MKAMYSFLSRAGRTLSVKPNQFFATSQAENVLKKFALSSAGAVALLFLFGGNVSGQVNNYTFTHSAGSYSQVSGTNSTAVGNDGTQTGIPIGFSFVFDGVAYTEFGISTNGMIRLGSGAITDGQINALGSAAALSPCIAPFWDDNNRNTGSITYTTSGSAPNRILSVGWNLINIGSGAANTSHSSFSVKLLEGTNQIEFDYGNLAGAGQLSGSVGINGANTFLSITPYTVEPPVQYGVSSTVANNNIGVTANLPGKKFTFTPIPSCSSAPSPANNATGVTLQESPTLSWAAVSGATGYDVYLGTVSGSLTLVSANQVGTTYSPSSLSASTLYYWKVVPVNTHGSPAGCAQWSFTTAELIYQTTFIETVTWTAPAGVTSVRVEAWGGGGAGGGAVKASGAGTYNGGGGAGGAYAKGNVTVVPGMNYTVTVGIPISSTSTSSSSVHGGNPSWFGSASTVYAEGGPGGTRAGGTAFTIGAGGAGSSSSSIGSLQVAAGQNGANGNTGATGSAGGAGAFGGGAGGAGVTGSGNNDGIAPGGGGSGGRVTGTPAANRTGGKGARGQIKISYNKLTYKSEITSTNLGSTSWCAGETRDVSVTIKNIGTATWTNGTGGTPTINIGVKWNNWTDYHVRTSANNLAPGQTATYTFTIKASDHDGTAYGSSLVAGNNNLTFDVRYEGISWFGNNSGGVGPGNTVSTSVAQTISALPTASVSAENGSICSGNTANFTLTGTSGSNVSYTINGTAGSATLTSGTASVTVTNAAANQTLALVSVTDPSTGCSQNLTETSTVTVNATGTWIGGASGNWNDAGNWCGGVPSSSAVITSNAVVTINTSNVVTVANLTLNAGSMLIIPNGAKLTISGALINNGGTVKVESGGSLVQEGATANSGTGTYIVEREMSGTGGSTPNGRFWYTGVPMIGATSAGFSAQGPSNKLWSHSETTGAYTEIDNNTTVLNQGKGYVFRGGNTGTYSFTSNNIGNGQVVFNLTRTASSAKVGFNLISNPYPSHLNWSALYATTLAGGVSPLLPTVWYRSMSANNVMTFDTYNYDGGIGTNNSGTAVTGIVAPFQSFWVRLNTVTSATMTATNAMRSHGNQAFLTLTPALVRLNLSNGISHDEALVFIKDDLSNDYDYRDSGKEISSATVHQLYSLEGTNKVAINGIANALAKDSLELGVQIPTAGTYSINCSEFTFSDLVYLEDKLNDAYIQLDNTSTYTFISAAGTFHNRFVLHFAPVPALPGETAATAIAMPTSNWPQCNNVTTEDQWHAFTATSEGISIAVNTATTDIVIALQDGTGNVIAQENAVNGIGNETLNLSGLTAGQTYRVGVQSNIPGESAGTYNICVKSLKRGGCDYGAGPYSLCQYYKATWAGSTGVSYTFTFTGTSGPAAGQTFTRTQNSDICVLSAVTPLLPYGSTYDAVISNTYTLNDGAGNTEQISVPSNSGCQVITMAEPQTTLSANSSCNNGARFRGAVVSSMPWVCGANNWRWRFTEVNPLTMQEVGLPIELNRGSASNYLNLGTVAQLQNGKTYAVQTAPMFSYTGTNYSWGPTQYMCIVGVAGMTLEGADASQGAEQGSTKDALQDASQVDAMVYVTEGNQLNIQLTNTANNTAKRADIYDVTGKLVKSVRLVEGMNKVNLSEASGMYTVRLVHGTQSETHRVIIQK